jgi:multidrug efflux pump subunit AcrB
MIAWFARNHVAANLLMAMLVAGGLLTLPHIKQEVFPEIDLPVVAVSVEYPGASPQEVEEAICVRIEQELQGLQGVKHVHSTAAEGIGSVSVELLAGEDVRRRLDDIRTRVDSITTFPESARRPLIQQADIRFQVLDVAISGAVDERTLHRLGEQAREEIAALPGITDAELVWARPYEIAIEVSEDALRRFDLTFDDVAGAVQRSSLDLPGGSVKTRGGEILLRTRGQAYRGPEFEALPLRTLPDGTRLALGDVAVVVDGFEESDRVALFDGEPAVLVQVYRVGQQSALEISRQVRTYLDEAEGRLPEGVHFTLAQDDARILRDRLATLLDNAQGGFALVVLVLALFLRLRLALWVSLGVPISFLGALWLLPSLDVSINLISLMAFIIVLGIVVDDAIIIGENAHTQQLETGDVMGGAIRGAIGVGTPVVFGVLTTVAAFAPMLFVPGPMGRVARVIPLVVIICLLFSLIESLFVLPAHLAHGGALESPPRTRLSRGWRAFQDRVARGLQSFIQDCYRPALERAIEWRYLTVASGLAVLILTTGLLAGGWIKFTFQPSVENDVAVAYVTMPQGTPVEVTRAAVEQLARAAEQVADGARQAGEVHAERGVFAHVSVSVGQQPYRLKQASGASSFAAASRTGANLGEIQLEVVRASERRVSVGELTRRWREATGEVIGAEELSFSSELISKAAPIDIEMRGRDLETLRAGAEALEARLARYPGVIDVADSFRGGMRELDIEILPSAEALGLSVADLGRQVRQAFFGHEAQRIQRGQDDVPVMVRYPASERRSLADLERMRIRTTDGSAVPFSAVARATLGQGYSTIRRIDRRRVVTVTADVDNAVSNANDVVKSLRERDLPEIEASLPGVSFSFEGEQREQSEFLESLTRGWLMALLAIYALLAIPLRSYTQPLIIMSAIPFGLVGAVWGHLLMGYDFSMLSVIGLVALSGVVVNDSLVLVDHVNQHRNEGASLERSLIAAGTARFRAIMLTSLTTFAGLTPLMLETSMQARMLIPMGISLAFGVIFATAITLLLVPCAYLILDSAAAWLRGRLGALAGIPGADTGARSRFDEVAAERE